MSRYEVSEELQKFCKENIMHVEKEFMFNTGSESASLYLSGGESVEFTEQRAKDFGMKMFHFDWEPKEGDTDERERFKEEFGIDPYLDLDLNPKGRYEADNSYNWAYLGITDFNYRIYKTKDGERSFIFLSIHGGGDARSNYLMPYVMEGELEDICDFYCGCISFVISFNDGSEVCFYSEQDTDVYNFKYESMQHSVPPSANRLQMTFLEKQEEVEMFDREDYNNSMAGKFIALAQAEASDEYNDRQLDELLDWVESHSERHIDRPEEQEQKKIYEAYLNTQLGMAYGWTMMARGTMKRVFQPREFNDGFKKWKEEVNNA